MVDVFISYKQEEREAINVIATTLSALKIDVWFDAKLRSGTSFDESIADALASAKAVLVCWTPAAIQSEWVRSEATQALDPNRLAACFLQETALIAPFNLIHAEHLEAWAGQEDDQNWLSLLDRIGQLIGRPGIASYHAEASIGASPEKLRAWVANFADDPLAEEARARLSRLGEEDANQRAERERTERGARAARRRAQAEKSRQLIRERGLRDPVRERRRWLALAAAVASVGIILAAFIGYNVDAQAAARELQRINTLDAARQYLEANRWRFAATALARDSFDHIDEDVWRRASETGTADALQQYIAAASREPRGHFLTQAHAQLAGARQVQQVQQKLGRLLLYRGSDSGAYDDATRHAVHLFRYYANLQVTDQINGELQRRLDVTVDRWIHPRLEDLHAVDGGVDPPSADELVSLTSLYGIDAPALLALADLQQPGNRGAFGPDGRPVITFWPNIFARRTGHRFDQTNPNVSRPSNDLLGRTQTQIWGILAEAYALDPDDAFASTSVGKFQIPGLNYASYGFQTPGEFVRYLSQSQINQYEAALRFARVNHLLPALREHDWNRYALGYFGPNYQQNRYAERLAQFYAEEAAKMTTPGISPVAPTLTPAAPAH